MTMLGTYILNKGRDLMNTLFKILMFVGVAILLYNAAARPDNIILFSIVGMLLLMIPGFMLVLNSKRDKTK